MFGWRHQLGVGRGRAGAWRGLVRRWGPQVPGRVLFGEDLVGGGPGLAGSLLLSQGLGHQAHRLQAATLGL